MKKKITAYINNLTFRMAAGIILWVALFAAAVSWIGYDSFTDSFVEEYINSALRTASTAEQIVNGNMIDAYLERRTGSAYESLRYRINNVCQKQEVTYIYVIKLDAASNYERYQFVFSTAIEDGEHTPREVDGTYWNTTNEEYRSLYEDICENGAENGVVMRTSGLQEGTQPHITVLVPVKNNAGEVTAILCVERPISTLIEDRQRYLGRTLYVTIAMTVFSVAAIVYYLRGQFVHPTRQIIAETRRFTKENTLADFTKLENVSRIGEMQELVSALEKMEQRTLRYFDNLKAATAERERLDTELALAKRIQAHVLPHLFPPFPERKEFDIYAIMKPAKEVGGDFYDFFLLDHDHLGLVMADVSGKGVPAALFMMATKLLIKTYAMIGGSPEKVLQTVNAEICRSNSDTLFVTVWLAILDLRTGQVTACNAGHEYPAIRRRDGQFELLKDRHGFVIGGMEDVQYHDYSFKLGVGDTVFVYTDGVTEATDSEQNMFGTGRMLAALNIAPDAGPEQLLHNVGHSVHTFVGDAAPFDDITMMAVRLNCLQTETCLQTCPELGTVTAVADFLEQRAGAMGLSPKTATKMQIAADEIYSNIVHYSKASFAAVHCEHVKGVPTLTFVDDGIPYDPTLAAEPDTTLSAEERKIGGLGILVVKRSTTSMTYRREGGQNMLTLTFAN